MKSKLLILSLFLMLLTACLPGISITPTQTARVITATPQPTSTASASPIPPTDTPEPVGRDRVNIYLVAVGDNGVTGEQIGCGDSLVPVEVQIEPTLAVLRAAYTELFKLEGESDYGQSDLYNALYLSDLSIADLAVIDGEAIVELEGELIFGGECDIPRIEEQLRATALQFETVDTVSITVNGEPLEELLDLRG